MVTLVGNYLESLTSSKFQHILCHYIEGTDHQEDTMITPIIWATAAVLYALFYSWYIGFQKKVTAQEAEALVRRYEKDSALTSKQLISIGSFLANDDGKDFVMVNLLHLKQPVKESRRKLETYQKVFLGQLLKKAGHPVMFGRAASSNIENLDCESADDWTAFGMVRYRSRRDMLEILLDTINSDHHQLKLESMQKTFAFPAAPWSMVGGPKILVPMGLALLAMILELAQA